MQERRRLQTLLLTLMVMALPMFAQMPQMPPMNRGFDPRAFKAHLERFITVDFGRIAGLRRFARCDGLFRSRRRNLDVVCDGRARATHKKKCQRKDKCVFHGDV